MDPCLLACAQLASSYVVLFRIPYLGDAAPDSVLGHFIAINIIPHRQVCRVTCYKGFFISFLFISESMLYFIDSQY